jgi:hypothetical protein
VRPRRRLAGVALAALAVLAIAGCGRRGPPVAPERRVPVPVTDVSAIVTGNGIELSWANPERRADNTPLRDLTAVRVFRAEDDGTGDPKPALLANGRVAGYSEVATVRLSAPAPASITAGRGSLVDARSLVMGRRYTYVLLAEDSFGRVSSPSRRATVRFIAPPAPPQALRATAGDAEARLAWDAPERLADGSPLAGTIAYEVLRAPAGPTVATQGGAPPALARIGGAAETRYVDRGLENERTYDYAVRAVRIEGETRAIGASTPRASVTPVDMAPPSPPTDLVAIPSGTAVRLSWRASPEVDVAAYVVLRAAPGAAFERVGTIQSPGTTFVDRDVPRGTWRYAVIAEDGGSRRNPSARSNEASVSVP